MRDLLITASAFIMFLMCSVTVKADDMSLPRPYISVKRGIHRVRFHEGFGEPVFNNSFHMNSYGVGVQLTDNMLLEIWHGSSRTYSKLRALEAGRYLPGCHVCVPGDVTCVLNTKTKHASTDLHLMYTTDKMWNTRLLFAGGLSKIKLKAHHHLHSDNMAGMPAPDVVALSSRSYNIKQFVPRGMFGVEHFINNCFSVRAEYDWKRTQGKSARSDERPNGHAKIRMRSTSVLSLGFSYNF